MNVLRKWIHSLEEHRLDQSDMQLGRGIKGWPYPLTKEFRRKGARKFKGVNYSK